MKPIQIWTRIYKIDKERSKKDHNVRDPNETLIDYLLQTETKFEPIGNPPVSYIDFKNETIVNVIDDFTKETPLPSNTYRKNIEIQAPSKEAIPEELTRLLKNHNFTLLK